MRFLQTKGIVIRDLKGENMMFVEGIELRIIDLETLRFVEAGVISLRFDVAGAGCSSADDSLRREL